MAAWAVNREFVSIYILSPWLPFGVFGAPLVSLGATLGSIGLPLGSIWLPLGSIWLPLGSIWFPLGSMRLPLGVHLGLLGPLGGSLGCLGAYSRFLSKMDLQFRADGSQVRSLSTKVGLPEFISGFPGFRGFRGFRGSGRNATWPAARNPPSSRRGLG